MSTHNNFISTKKAFEEPPKGVRQVTKIQFFRNKKQTNTSTIRNPWDGSKGVRACDICISRDGRT